MDEAASADHLVLCAFQRALQLAFGGQAGGECDLHRRLRVFQGLGEPFCLRIEGSFQFNHLFQAKFAKAAGDLPADTTVLQQLQKAPHFAFQRRILIAQQEIEAAIVLKSVRAHEIRQRFLAFGHGGARALLDYAEGVG